MSETENYDEERFTPPPAEEFALGKVIEQAKQVITDPAGFYRAMPREGGYREPVTFTLVMAAIAGGIFALLSIIGLTGAGFGGVVAIIVLPIAVVVLTCDANALDCITKELACERDNRIDDICTGKRWRTIRERWVQLCLIFAPSEHVEMGSILFDFRAKRTR